MNKLRDLLIDGVLSGLQISSETSEMSSRIEAPASTDGDRLSCALAPQNGART